MYGIGAQASAARRTTRAASPRWQRGPNGDYVAVSSRGNFFLTWSPGETYWQPHNRPTCAALVYLSVHSLYHPYCLPCPSP